MCSRCSVAYVLRRTVSLNAEPRWLWQRDCSHRAAEPEIRKAADPAPTDEPLCQHSNGAGFYCALPRGHEEGDPPTGGHEGVWKDTGRNPSWTGRFHDDPSLRPALDDLWRRRKMPDAADPAPTQPNNPRWDRVEELAREIEYITDSDAMVAPVGELLDLLLRPDPAPTGQAAADADVIRDTGA